MVRIEREIKKEKGQDQEEAKTKVDYEYMSEILKNKVWKFQDHQEEIHKAERCGMCELASEIRKAEHMATTVLKTRKKFKMASWQNRK